MRFVVFIEYTDLTARERALAEHRAYLRAGRAAGTVVESGPFTDGEGGLYILDAGSEEVAQDFVREDPYSRVGMKLTLREWQSSREQI